MIVPAWRCFTFFISILPLLCVAANWPQFRGPHRSGVSEEMGLPTHWDSSHNILWRSELPGPGASSPIILDGHVYLTCYSGYGLNDESPGEQESLKRHVLCFDLEDGKKKWSIPFQAELPENPYQGFQALHGYASSTPATDGKSLFVFLGRTGVHGLSLTGRTLWHQSVGDGTHGWGSGTSPVLYRDMVIINANVESKSIVAFDGSTGKEIWRAAGVNSAWNTPLLVEVPGGGDELVVSSQNEIHAYDPKDGTRLWRCDGIRDYVCPSVISHNGIVFAIGGRRGTAVAVRAGGRGDVTETHRLWEINKGSNVCSPVYDDGYLYWCHESRGIAYCVNAADGRVAFEQRMSPRPGRIYASPVAADGKIYIVSRTQGIYVLAAKPKYTLLAHNEPLDDSVFNGSIAVSDGKLLVRSDKYVYCIGH